MHGSAKVSEYIYRSDLINSKFDTRYINISSESELSSLGKMNIKKVIRSIGSIGVTLVTLLRFKPSLCHFCFHPFGLVLITNVLLLTILRLFRVRVVLHMHCKGIENTAESKFRTRIYRHIFSNNSVILLDKRLYRDIAHLGEFKKPIYYLANGVNDLPQDKKTLTQEQTEAKTIQFLFLSNLMPQKGAHDLLDAFYLLQNRGVDNISLVIAGASIDKPYDEKLKSKLISMGNHTQVRFTGNVDENQKEYVFREADVFVLPTYNDCFPLVILEAMKYSLPIISTNVGAIPNIISGQCGKIIESGDIEQLAQSMSSYVSNAQLRNQHALNARQRQQEFFSLERFESGLYEILMREAIATKT